MKSEIRNTKLETNSKFKISDLSQRPHPDPLRFDWANRRPEYRARGQMPGAESDFSITNVRRNQGFVMLPDLITAMSQLFLTLKKE